MSSILTPKDLILVPDLTADDVEDVLKNYGLQDLPRASRNLQSLTGEPLVREACAEIMETLLECVADSAHPDSALHNFARFVDAASDPLRLYQILRDAPFLISILAKSFGSSTYFSDILIRNPEYINGFVVNGIIAPPKPREIMDGELCQSLRSVDSVEQKLDALRRYKRKESLRIGVRDLIGAADLETTTLELSNLAEAALQKCCEIGEHELTSRFGTPQAEQHNGETIGSTFAVIGMGKFGGRELNFSSDIDVMFVYSRDGTTNQGVENRQYFNKLSEFIINGLSEITGEGYVFRVDARLRPESSAGSIARSIDSYEAYYEGWGEIWERQALIKARPVAGDLQLGRQFIDTIQPFVYQRYLDEFSIAEIKMDIRQTKSRIEDRIREKGSFVNNHVKLGIGCIRDMEFTIQCLQLIYGGPIPALRNCNSLETIDLLHQHKFLSPRNRDVFADAYRFLRMVEHRLQMEADQQRYSLPSKTSELVKLARSTGYRDTKSVLALEAFHADYRQHTHAVRLIFEKILEIPVPDGGIDLASLFTTTDAGVVREILNPYGFADPHEARRRLKTMAEGSDGVRFSPTVRRLFVQLAPVLLHFIAESPDPDMAIRYIDVFTSKVGARASYYTLFRDNPSIIEMLTKICGTSRFLAELLIEHPESFDVLTVSAVMARPKTLTEKQQETLEMIANTTPNRIFDRLRQYKNSEILRIGMRSILAQAELESEDWDATPSIKADLWTTTAELSDLAEATLKAMFAHVKDMFIAEHGRPMVDDGSEATLTIIGMGKFGGGELNFSSDLDVMLVYSADGKTTKGATNADYFSDFGLALVNRLKGSTGGGSIYELDLRLRPFGNGGAIAMPLSGFQNYYDKNAETWERQALTRARPVAGDMELGNQFIAQAHAFTYRHPLTPDEVTQIAHTRKRKEAQATRPAATRRRRRSRTRDVKAGYGGLVDIEFAVQIIQLIHGTDSRQVRVQHTVEAIKQLHEIDALTNEQKTQLLEAYGFLRRVENSLRIVHDRPLDALPDKAAELEKLARRLGYVDQNGEVSNRFLKDYHECTERTRKLFHELLGFQN